MSKAMAQYYYYFVFIAFLAVVTAPVRAGGAGGRSDDINCKCPHPIPIQADMTGLTLVPGCYYSVSAFAITAALTLDGGASSLALNGSGQFIFVTPAALNTAASSTIVLTGGARARDVKWCIGAAATLGASSIFFGNIATGPAGAITIGASARVTGVMNSGAGVITAGALASLTQCATANSNGRKIADCECANAQTIPNSLSAQVLTPGCYKASDDAQPFSLAASTSLSLVQPNPLAPGRFVFISKNAGVFGVGADSVMALTNGTACADINWCVGGSVIIGDRAKFYGNIQTGASGVIRLGAAVQMSGSLGAGSGVVTVATDEAESASTIGPVTSCTEAASGGSGVHIPSPPTLDEQYQLMFAQFMYSHNKLYRCDSLLYRFAVFKSNLQAIQSHNTRDTAFAVSMNSMGDLTPEEFKSTRLGLRAAAPAAAPAGSGPVHRASIQLKQLSAGLHAAKLAAATAATKVKAAAMRARASERRNAPNLQSGSCTPTGTDWRTTAVAGVKNQGSCGSCYAFSGLGAMEGALAIHSGVALNGGEERTLSVQQIIECSSALGNLGCGGGYMTAVFEYAITNLGVSLASAYPYTGYLATCSGGSDGATTRISAYVNVPYMDETALRNAVDLGPVSVGISAASSTFQFYSAGIYSDPLCSTALDHGVLVVGYGTDATNGDYWIVKNSWGTAWGLNGFVLMRRGVNQCGISQIGTYPVV